MYMYFYTRASAAVPQVYVIHTSLFFLEDKHMNYAAFLLVSCGSS